MVHLCSRSLLLWGCMQKIWAMCSPGSSHERGAPTKRLSPDNNSVMKHPVFLCQPLTNTSVIEMRNTLWCACSGTKWITTQDRSELVATLEDPWEQRQRVQGYQTSDKRAVIHCCACVQPTYSLKPWLHASSPSFHLIWQPGVLARSPT